MPRSNSSGRSYARPRSRGHRGRRPRDWRGGSSIGSFSRRTSPFHDRRTNLSHDITDRGRDLDRHHHNSLFGGPHGGRYGWSSSNDSGEFYPPTRIPRDSFHDRRLRGRLADCRSDDSDAEELWNRTFPRYQYRESEVDYSCPIRRSNADAVRDIVWEGRIDENRRREGRREARSHYRDLSAIDGDYEDEESGWPEGYRDRRERERSTRRGWQSLNPTRRTFAMEYNLDVLERDWLNRHREHANPASDESSEGPRMRQRRRLN